MIVNQSSSNALDLKVSETKRASSHQESLQTSKATDEKSGFKEVYGAVNGDRLLDKHLSDKRLSTESAVITQANKPEQASMQDQSKLNENTITGLVGQLLGDNHSNMNATNITDETTIDSNHIAGPLSGDVAGELTGQANLSSEELANGVISDQLQMDLTNNVMSEVAKMAEAPRLAMASSLVEEKAGQDPLAINGANNKPNPWLNRKELNAQAQKLQNQTLVNQTVVNQSSAEQATANAASVKNSVLLDGLKGQFDGLKRSSDLNNSNATLLQTLTSSNTGLDLERGLQFKALIAQDNKASTSELSQKLHNILADKLSVQLSAKTPSATIRLDPADLGKIDMTVRLDNDKLQIQIAASNGQTREAIQMTADRLRHELVNQNFLSVEVSISNGEQPTSNQFDQTDLNDQGYAVNPLSLDSDGNGDNEADLASDRSISNSATNQNALARA